MSTVREMSDVIKESHSSGKDVIIGGIHPLFGAKGAESEKPVPRCRYVFTGPRAWTASGLDVNSLYQEVSSSPITFQGSRTLRAYAALKGYEISTRDVKSACKANYDGKAMMTQSHGWLCRSSSILQDGGG